MIVAKIANSKNDEYYTPRCAVEPIIKYLKPNSTIWCPFDTEESEYPKTFYENDFDVFLTHIDTGFDFFNMNVPYCDYIISNPPYSKKYEVLERLFEIDRPFAMLVGVVGLFDSMKKAELFSKNEFEIMYLNPRVKYKKNTSPPYQSVYICHKILPKQIIFEKIKD